MAINSSEAAHDFSTYPEAPRRCSAWKFRVGVHGQEDHGDIRRHLFDLLAGIQAVQQVHGDVGDDDIRFQLQVRLQQLSSIRHNTDYF